MAITRQPYNLASLANIKPMEPSPMMAMVSPSLGTVSSKPRTTQASGSTSAASLYPTWPGMR